MITRSKLLAGALAMMLVGSGAAGCKSIDERNRDRWATTENTNVKIDWDKVNDAYEKADGPEDLEKRINEIYEGDEVISISVHDTDGKTQVVTGFFDHNTDGKVDEAEKIFTIQRDLTGEGKGQYQTQGSGHYAGYHSPMMGIMTGMLMGSMMSSMLMPSYSPRYSQPYATTSARHGELRSQRSGYRAQNPQRFAKPSKTGRSYGGDRGGGGSAPRSRGGGRFGRAAGAGAKPVRLAA